MSPIYGFFKLIYTQKYLGVYKPKKSSPRFHVKKSVRLKSPVQRDKMDGKKLNFISDAELLV